MTPFPNLLNPIKYKMKTTLPTNRHALSNTLRAGLFNPMKSITLLFLFSVLLFGARTFAQAPTPCGSVNCTSNDVQVISAYISAPGDMPIDCNLGDPFNNAELHLIVSSNTQRIGIS